MRIADLYAAGGSPVLSLEFFTPKDEAGREALFRAVERLATIEPGFVSITCGAAGTTRERTADLAIEAPTELRSDCHGAPRLHGHDAI